MSSSTPPTSTAPSATPPADGGSGEQLPPDAGGSGGQLSADGSGGGEPLPPAGMSGSPLGRPPAGSSSNSTTRPLLAPGGGACGDPPHPPCLTADGGPPSALPRLNASSLTTFSGDEQATYMESMATYAASYAASGSIGNAAQALGNVALLLNQGGYNASYAAAQRGAYLATMVSSLGSAGPPTSAADMATAASALQSMASTPSQMDHASVELALSGLSTLAGQPPSVMDADSLSTVSSTLGSVVQAAMLYRGTAPGNATSAFGSVMGVLGTLATSQAAGLTPGGAPQSMSSDYFKMRVRVDRPGDPSAPIFTSGLQLDNSTVAFDPLPSNLFTRAGVSSDANVTTTFLSMTFDPWSSNDTSVGSVTRLAFTADNATVPVANLTSPLTFTLPAVNLTGLDGMHAACMWYDEDAAAYLTDGCYTRPALYPVNHTLSWATDNVTFATDGSLAGAWAINGSLFDAACTDTVLDCGTEAGRAGSVTLSAGDSVLCGNLTAGALRVFSGAACMLWQAGNAADCFWNTTQQMFAGDGCVASELTNCACRHATDFASAPQTTTVTISVLSADDLVNFSIEDVVTKCVLLAAGRGSRYGCVMRRHALTTAALTNCCRAAG